MFSTSLVNLAAGRRIVSAAPPATVPAYVGTGGLVNLDGTGTLNVPYPAGLLAGDKLVIVNSTYIGTVVAAISGWTLIADPPGFEDATSRVLAFTATGAETGVLGIPVTGTKSWSAMYAFRGAAAISNTTQDTTSTKENAPAVTAPAANTLAVAIFTGYATGAPPDIAGESGGAWVQRYTFQAPGFEAGALWTADMAAAGTISGGTSGTAGAMFGPWAGVYLTP